MTQDEFYFNALLHIAGNSNLEFFDTKEWADKVDEAARALMDVARERGYEFEDCKLAHLNAF